MSELVIFFENHIGEIIAVTIAILGLVYGYKADRRAQKSSTYVNIDTNLKDVLAEAKTNPNLRDMNEIPNLLNENNQEYNIYAEMCMNLVETIYDDALEYPSNRITYAPTAVWEIILHGEWFEQNQLKFKPAFRTFVCKIRDDLIRDTFDQTKKEIDDVCKTIKENPERYIDRKQDPKKKIRYTDT